MQPHCFHSLSNDSILSFAKDILRPYTCEWGTCSIILNSWRSYEKHIQVHCQQEATNKPGGGRCRWRCCLGITGGLDIARHVNLAHLNRLALHCPFKDCTEMFTNHKILPEHFFRVHWQFEKAKPASVFLPHARRSARLLIPPKQDLPSLPTNPALSTSLNETYFALRKTRPAAEYAPSQSQNVVGRGRRRRRGKIEETGARRVRTEKEPDTEEQSDDECRVKLDSVQHERDVSKAIKLMSRTHCVVWRPKAKAWATIEEELGDSPAPGSSSEPSVNAPPMSFGFEKLKKLVDV